MTRVIVCATDKTSGTSGAHPGAGRRTLTDEGLAQARAIAERLAREPFEALVSSDLGRRRCHGAVDRRALRQARRARTRGFAEPSSARDREDYDEVDRSIPGAFARVRKRRSDSSFPAARAGRQFHDRVCEAFDSLAATHAARTIVVVTHGGVLATFFRHGTASPGCRAPARHQECVVQRAGPRRRAWAARRGATTLTWRRRNFRGRLSSGAGAAPSRGSMRERMS